MRKILLFYATILLIASATVVAKPVYNSIVMDFKTPVEDFLPVDSKVYVAFSNGTISLIDLEKSLTLSQVIMPLGMSTACLAYNRTTLLVVDTTGVGVVLNSSTLQPLYSLNLKKNDELYVTRCTLSGNGRFLAMSVSYTNDKVKLDRLVVFDVLKKTRIFERDVYSQDVLVKLFSLDFYGNYLVVETIDTLCELCQLTDNKIEVYSVKPNGVDKVASLQTGLTIKALGNGYMLAQQVKEEDNGLHNTSILTLPNLKIISQKKMQAFLQISPLNDSFIVVLPDGTLARCGLDLSCSNIFHVPTSRAVRTFTESLLSIFTVGEASLYSTDYTNKFILLGRYQVNWTTVPFDPTTGKASGGVHVSRYGSNRLVILYPISKALVQLKVTNVEGLPISGATVLLVSSSGTFPLQTNSSGWAVGVLPIGNYTVEVLSPGYSSNSFILGINQPVVYVTTIMSKEPPKRLPLSVRITDEYGKPVPGAKVVIRGPEVYELQTTFDGTAYVEALRGNYTLIVQAALYQGEKENFSLEKPITINITLKRLKFNLTICSSSEASGGLLIKLIGSSSRQILLNLSPLSCQEKVLDAGTYQLSIIESPEGLQCSLNSTLIEWTENTRHVYVSYNCSKPVGSNYSSLSAVIRILGNETLISRNLSKPLALGAISMLGGTPLDLLKISYQKILVIELFYTQCTGCKYMLPTLKSLSMRNDTVVVSLTVSPSDTPELLRRYSIENGVSWYLGSDDLNIRSQVNASSFPTVLVVKDGRLVFMGIGAKKEIEEAKNKYSSLFNMSSLPFSALTGKIIMPETLILTGVFLIILALIPGDSSVKKEARNEENNLGLYSGDVHPLSNSLRSDNAEAISTDDDDVLEYSFEKNL